MKNFDFTQVEENLKRAGSIIIAFPAQASFANAAASLGLYLSLIEFGKKVAIISSGQPTVGLANLVGINKVKQEVSGQDLTISFDYIQDSIEKVSYNIENNKFNLVVQTKTGFPSLDPNSVTYSQAGLKGEIVFIIGAISLMDLGEIYQKNKSFFDEALIINIDNQVNNSQFGKVNLIDGATSTGEIVLSLIKTLKLPMNNDVANNLFLGLKEETGNFSKTNVSAETFEAAALCLRYGAKIEPGTERIEKKIKEEEKKPQVPQDWLGPKIFQSSRKV